MEEMGHVIGLPERNPKPPQAKKKWKQPARPEYVRRQIDYERETEIPILIKQGRHIAVDSGHGEDNYELYGCETITPLDLLIAKEESGWQDSNLR